MLTAVQAERHAEAMQEASTALSTQQQLAAGGQLYFKVSAQLSESIRMNRENGACE